MGNGVTGSRREWELYGCSWYARLREGWSPLREVLYVNRMKKTRLQSRNAPKGLVEEMPMMALRNQLGDVHEECYEVTN